MKKQIFFSIESWLLSMTVDWNGQWFLRLVIFLARIWPPCLLSLTHGILAQPFLYTEIANITLSASDFI